MSEKQDRAYARTAQDIERKYSFGKTFGEMLGLINESREKVDAVESSLRKEITETATTMSRDTERIVMTAAENVKKELNGSITEVSNNVSQLSSKVEMKLDANAVNVAIEKKLENGVSRVETTTGRFDSEGLKISISDRAISNLIDNTGMYVKNNGEDMLAANDKGVDAVNLHAKTYLIVGKDDGRSRFEDYLENRTACFWIGG